jgi:regulator of CtrA degradation
MASPHGGIGVPAPISFAHRLAGSQRFKSLFRDGMDLVEEVAAYLDGPGREEARHLPRAVAAAYAAESMRLTTRLMQVASWLLVQRAVNEGDMSPDQAQGEKHKVRLCAQEVASGPGVFAQLPPALRDLTERSLRLQTRIIYLDRTISLPEAALSPAPNADASAFALQRERIIRAFHRS